MNETWYVMVFGVAASEFGIGILNFNMADSKWPNQIGCQILKYYRDLQLYIGVFGVAASEFGIGILNFNMADSIWLNQND